MTTQIEVEGVNVPFRLVAEHGRWHSIEELKEADFPLIKTIDGNRYELYSDGTFAEVEK
jgi:hypothetical protein